MTIDNSQFDFYSEDDAAWFNDDNKVIFAMKKGFKLIEKCIIHKYDNLYSVIPENEKQLYFEKLMMTLCSEMDEKEEENFGNYNYNLKIMKRNIIQNGFQEKNQLSSLLYLQDTLLMYWLKIKILELYFGHGQLGYQV